MLNHLLPSYCLLEKEKKKAATPAILKNAIPKNMQNSVFFPTERNGVKIYAIRTLLFLRKSKMAAVRPFFPRSGLEVYQTWFMLWPTPLPTLKAIGA